MQPDSVYPSDGEWFAQPDQQVQEAHKEKNELSQAKPLVRKVIKRFDDQIKFYDSIDSVTVSLNESPAEYQRVMETHKLIKQYLQGERDYIMSLLEKR